MTLEYGGCSAEGRGCLLQGPHLIPHRRTQPIFRCPYSIRCQLLSIFPDIGIFTSHYQSSSSCSESQSFHIFIFTFVHVIDPSISIPIISISSYYITRIYLYTSSKTIESTILLFVSFHHFCTEYCKECLCFVSGVYASVLSILRVNVCVVYLL